MWGCIHLFNREHPIWHGTPRDLRSEREVEETLDTNKYSEPTGRNTNVLMYAVAPLALLRQGAG